MMKPYTDLAQSYDYLLKHVDYHQWYMYISTLMIRYVRDPRVVLELGCGTGKFGAKFSADDFVIYGLDISIEMLKVARLRSFKNFSIICADMTNFYFTRKFDFIFSVHDTMNYFIEYDDVRKVFRSVRELMDEESVFMFDITTDYNITKHFDGKSVKYNSKDADIEWSNTYDREQQLVFSLLKFKRKNGELSEEEHVQRIYTIDEIKRLLDEEGFDIIEIFGDYSFHSPAEKTIMINFVTRKRM